MPVKNVLVALDGSQASRAAMEAAISMQKAYDAHNNCNGCYAQLP